MPARIDLNADVGEFALDDPARQDDLLMRAITSANIACGLHAGDARVMRETIHLALAHGIAVGAHPSFDDREGFGRREMQLAPHDVERLILSQLEVLAAIADGEGARLIHVKPHGALYNMAARDRTLADAVAAAVSQFDRSLIVYGLAGSHLLAAAAAAGLRSAAEVFADRGYSADGSLLPRRLPGAVIDDEAVVIERALAMAAGEGVRSAQGPIVPLQADTICVHGDTPGAAQLAVRLRASLEAAGVAVRAIAAA